MNKDIEDIDGLVKESLKDFKAEIPSEDGWKKLSKQLIWINFLRFSPYRFNIYYLSSLTIAGIIATFIFGKPSENIKEKMCAPVQIVKQIEKKINNTSSNKVNIKSVSITEESNNSNKITFQQNIKKRTNTTTQKLPDNNVSTTKLVRDTIVIRKKVVVRDTIKIILPSN